MRKQLSHFKPRVIAVVAMLAGFLVQSALAQDNAATLHKPDEVLVQNDQLKVRDGFGAQFWVTDSQRFFYNWVKADARNLVPVAVTRRDIDLFLAIFIADPGEKRMVRPDGTVKRTSDVSYDFQVLKPDGSLYVQSKSVVGWIGRAPAPHMCQLLSGRSTVTFEVIDPPGEYTVNIKVHDNIKHVEIALQRKIVLQD